MNRNRITFRNKYFKYGLCTVLDGGIFHSNCLYCMFTIGIQFVGALA